ncbi:MAG: septum formation protein Maf [Clostridiaceae bacterium]|jgi:septum formation protein|nr:septum formation protein Maf [Clostridiaceae bacterium]
MLNLILASASPRRIELLKMIDLAFEVMPANIEEESEGFNDAGKYVMEMSKRKALYVAKKVRGKAAEDTFVLGADTVVSIDGIILGKPTDENHAFRMLKLMENRWHEVITGLTLVNAKTLKCQTDSELTRVKISSYPKGFMDRYLSTKEPYDKAGSYGIQGLGSLMVECIEGCYFNVMGLPLFRLSRMLEKEGHEVLSWLGANVV